MDGQGEEELMGGRVGRRGLDEEESMMGCGAWRGYGEDMIPWMADGATLVDE